VSVMVDESASASPVLPKASAKALMAIRDQTQPLVDDIFSDDAFCADLSAPYWPCSTSTSGGRVLRGHKAAGLRMGRPGFATSLAHRRSRAMSGWSRPRVASMRW
jgi:hypothetical protein